jgi:hypothetical protein
VHWTILAALLAGIPLIMRTSAYTGPLYIVGP